MLTSPLVPVRGVCVLFVCPSCVPPPGPCSPAGAEPPGGVLQGPVKHLGQAGGGGQAAAAVSAAAVSATAVPAAAAAREQLAAEWAALAVDTRRQAAAPAGVCVYAWALFVCVCSVWM